MTRGFTGGEEEFKKLYAIDRECTQCGSAFTPRQIYQAESHKRDLKYCSRVCYYKGKVGRKHTEATKKKMGISRSGDKNHFWRGDKVGYTGVHIWLLKHFPKKGVCHLCKTKTNFTENALVKGKKYERNRDNFIELCRSCHKRYDEVGKKAWRTRYAKA